MARNIGMGSPRRDIGGARLMVRYPRLLFKKTNRLVTIEEVPEEIVHEAVSCVFSEELWLAYGCILGVI